MRVDFEPLLPKKINPTIFLLYWIDQNILYMSDDLSIPHCHLFTWQAKNGQCKMADDYLYDDSVLSWTSEGRVGTYSYDLTAGVNVLYWSVFRFTSIRSPVPTVETLKNVVIQSIDITGQLGTWDRESIIKVYKSSNCVVRKVSDHLKQLYCWR